MSPKWRFALVFSIMSVERSRSGTSCDGFEEEFGECPNLQPCRTCTPVDCVWGNWSSWRDVGSCSRLRERRRAISIQNNECGQPCDGVKSEMVVGAAPDPNCNDTVSNCNFTAWTTWSECGGQWNQQRNRKRTFESLSSASGGAACEGPMSETQPCGAVVKINCTFAEWSSWTACSESCGGGFSTRLRQVHNRAEHDGAACSGDLEQSKKCELIPCLSGNATVSEWSEWSANCTGTAQQRSRDRHIVNTSSGGGTRFVGSLKEIGSCSAIKRDCVLSSWSNWTSCSVTCGSGQISRTRSVTPAENGGACSLTSVIVEEIDTCRHNASCTPPPKDCAFKEWTSWSSCDVSCGRGSQRRERGIGAEAVSGGAGCLGVIKELRECAGANGTLCPDDAKWEEWGEWTQCTCSCDGGSRERRRKLILGTKNKPLTNETSREIQACNTQTCSECVDGTYGAWSNWSTCSSTCSGFKRRYRNETSPGSCGKPLEGLANEYQKCNDEITCIKDVDCGISEWSNWTECSSSCYGSRSRHRSLISEASGQGEQCGYTELTQVLPCNPALDETPATECELDRNCTWKEWTNWSECSRGCGGGEMNRARDIVPSSGRGIPCVGNKREISRCNMQECNNSNVCIDCVWGQWKSWSECGHCGGQRTRSRDLEVIPTKCGKQCESQKATEVSNCTSPCTTRFGCGWSDWQEVLSCPVSGCDAAESMRSRALMFQGLGDSNERGLFSALQDASCTGFSVFHSPCPLSQNCTTGCHPQDCTFSAWSEWSGADSGICQRERTISGTNNECGKPCLGQLILTKPCAVVDLPIDCELEDWGAWSACGDQTRDQTRRQRTVKVTAQNGGEPCVGNTIETRPCYEPTPPKSCLFSNWTSWSSCSNSCGQGTRARRRHILQEADDGGSGCVGALKQLDPCSERACNITVVNCLLSEWTPFSQCDEQGLRTKTRSILVHSTVGGDLCSGHLALTENCPEDKVDCVVSDWTEWDLCTATCGGGKRTRLRQINKLASGGGRACPSSMIETGPCNTAKCIVSNCELADWSDWNGCSAVCGNGQQTRSRIVKKYASSGGNGCAGHLEEMRSCRKECTPVDCKLSVWSAWSSCTCSCGGGQHERTRTIVGRPLGGGLACEEGAFAQVEPCNTHICGNESCVDGLWGEWTEWSKCSTSCQGGTSFRSRKVSRAANACGTAVSGDSLQTRFCNVGEQCESDVNCTFREWTAWSTCSQLCDGITERSREVNQSGRGNGAFCKGAMKENAWCNRAINGTDPAECKPEVSQNCTLGQWSDWTRCTRTCGRGQRSRSRVIAQLPKGGGLPCHDALEVIEECNSDSCDNITRIDCKLGDWEDWSACSKCGGEIRRFRHVLSLPENGGAPCDQHALEDISKCPMSCKPTFCTWSTWAAWGDCRSVCGRGHRSRVRVLEVGSESSVALPDVDAVLGAFSELHLRTQAFEHNRLTELIVSFSCGLVTVMAVLGVWRIFGRFARNRTVHRVSTESREGLPRYGLLSEQGPLLGFPESDNLA